MPNKNAVVRVAIKTEPKSAREKVATKKEVLENAELYVKRGQWKKSRSKMVTEVLPFGKPISGRWSVVFNQNGKRSFTVIVDRYGLAHAIDFSKKKEDALGRAALMPYGKGK